MLLVRNGQLDKLEAAWQACADAVTPSEVSAAGDAFEAAVAASRPDEFKEFQAKRAPHVKFRDE